MVMFLLSILGTTLVVQWLGLCAPSSGGLGSIPGQETRPQMVQLTACMPQLRPGAAKQINT